jgi:hypothetical protein
MSDIPFDIELNAETIFEQSYGIVQPWFPKLVYFKDDLHLDKLSDWEDTVRLHLKDEADAYTATLPVKSNHNRSNLLSDPSLLPLWNTITDHANWFGGLMGYTRFDFNITNAWANISKQGDFLFPHLHQGSMISGAFYLKAVDTDKIVFMDQENIMLAPDSPNELTWNKVTYDCKPGRLLLFKSDTLHGVTKQVSAEDKIVVSFNLVGEWK